MIAVLQSGQQVADSILALQKMGLPMHSTPQKNWDHSLLLEVLSGVDRSSTIIDLGCGEGYTLDFLHAAGFKNLTGIDFKISSRLRLKRALRMWRARSLTPAYHLQAGNFLKTGLPSSSYDVVVSVSTIEHGVDEALFFQEAARLLKPGGKLFVTTDYWEEHLVPPSSPNAFKLPWKVFSKPEIEKTIATAASSHLKLLKASPIPSSGSPCVNWNGLDYTFIALAFAKV